MKEIASEGFRWIAFSKALVEAAGLRAGPPRPPQKTLAKDQAKKMKNLVGETGILSK